MAFRTSLTFSPISQKVFVAQAWLNYHIKADEKSFPMSGVTMLCDNYLAIYSWFGKFLCLHNLHACAMAFRTSLTFSPISQKVFVVQAWLRYHIKAYEKSFPTSGVTMLCDNYQAIYNCFGKSLCLHNFHPCAIAFWTSLTFSPISQKVFVTQAWFTYHIKADEKSFPTSGVTVLCDNYLAIYSSD